MEPYGRIPKKGGKEICKIFDQEEWILYTDGASNKSGTGAGLVRISPDQTEYTYSLQLDFKNTNNEAEYEALRRIG